MSRQTIRTTITEAINSKISIIIIFFQVKHHLRIREKTRKLEKNLVLTHTNQPERDEASTYLR